MKEREMSLQRTPVRVVLKDGLPAIEEATGYNPAVLAALDKASQVTEAEYTEYDINPDPGDAQPPEPPHAELAFGFDDDDLDECGVPRWLSEYDPTLVVTYGERVRRFILVEIDGDQEDTTPQ